VHERLHDPLCSSVAVARHRRRNRRRAHELADGAAIALADAYAALLASARECVSCVATANRSCDAADRELSRLEADLRAKPLVDAAVDH
jgi:hypothetical protein